MSNAMNEVYQEGFLDLPEELVDFMHMHTRPKTVEERSREAVKRMFEAVDAERAKEMKQN